MSVISPAAPRSLPRESKLLTSISPVVMTALALALFAGALRFYRIGDWPFYGDEMSTFYEGDALVEGKTDPSWSSQISRLPRLIPLSYVIHYIGWELFGRDEFGSRAILALLGTAQIVIVFWGLIGPLGYPTALCTSLLLAVWPEHIYQCQQHRFYMIAAFFSAICMVAGAQAVWRRSVAWTILACLAAFATILSHTIQGLALGGLFVGILLAAVAGRHAVPWRMLGVVVATMVAALALVVFYLLPIGQGWNTTERWGMGPTGGVRGAVYLVGWAVDLLAVLGAVLLFRERREQGAFWLTWAGLWLAASVVLPGIVVYHYAYVFPLSLGVIVLAGYAVGEIYAYLRLRSTAAAWVWLAAACGFNAMSLASHYTDGSRYDYRAAARYIEKHWQTGDRVAAVAGSALPFYASACNPTIHLTPTHACAELEKLCADGKRTWIVLNSDRGGLDRKTDSWLRNYCTLELDVRAKRLDYRDYVVEVFRYPATRTAAKE